MNYYFKYKSPIGNLIILSDGENINLLKLQEKYNFTDILKSAKNGVNLPIFEETIKWLDIYFSGNNPTFTPSIKPYGSDFQLSVWKILLTIPHGKTTTYGDIAKLIAKPKMSAQAVGGAIGKNPIEIIIPCHRVIGAGGNLTGFASGIDVKIKLLKQENIDISKFHMPKRSPVK